MKSLRISCLQHASFEGPGIIASWSERRGHTFRIVRLYAGETLPQADQVDVLVVMGGPMGVNDTLAYPWLVQEVAYLKGWMDEGKPILGICLGAQLMAHALGAEVGPNAQKEIGWHPIQVADDGLDHPLTNGFDTGTPTFHWHGDTFGLPEGARHLFRSEACRHQAFLWGKHSLGLQFHPEMTPETLDALIEHASDDLVDGPYVQSAEAMRAYTAGYDIHHKALETWLDRLTESSPNE